MHRYSYVGQCSLTFPPMLVLDYCRFGTLQSYLVRQHHTTTQRHLITLHGSSSQTLLAPPHHHSCSSSVVRLHRA